MPEAVRGRKILNIMQIKGMDGTSYNVASSGTGNTALGLGK